MSKQSTLRAFLYVRISDDKAGKGAGVARQADDGTALASRIGAEVVDVFNDNDRSATKGAGTRPEYERMLGAVANGECDVVIAYSQERLWRDEVEHPLFMRMAREVGVRVFLVNGGEVDPNDANHMLVSTILNAVAVMEVATNKRRLKREMVDRRKAGKYLGGPRAFGHNADRTEVVADEAALINDACERVLAGESIGSIVRDWQARDVRTITGRHFVTTTLGDLLKQPRLAALTEVNGNKHTRAKDGTAGKVLVAAEWPAIVDVDVWRDVCRVLAVRNTKRPAARKFVLSGGTLTCAGCGTPMNGGSGYKGVATYRCPPSTQVAGACGGCCINGPMTDAHVVDEMLKRIDTDDFAKAIKRAIKAHTNANLGTAVANLDRKRARRDDVEAMFTEGELSRAEYVRMRDTLNTEIARLEDEVMAHDGGPPVHLVGDGARLREAWEAMTFDEQRAVIAVMVKGVVVERGHRGKRWNPARLAIAWRY